MLTATALRNQRLIAEQMAHIAANRNNHEVYEISIKAAYSCSIALMMMQGNLDALPIV